MIERQKSGDGCRWVEWEMVESLNGKDDANHRN